MLSKNTEKGGEFPRLVDKIFRIMTCSFELNRQD